MLEAQPHHDGSALYVGEVPPALAERSPLRVRTPHDWQEVQRVWVRSVQDGEPRYDEAARLGDADGWTWWEATMLVANPVAKYRFLFETASDAGRPAYWWLNSAGLHNRDVSDYADFRLGVFAPVPDWVPRSAMYQIFPDRFARSAGADAHTLPEWAVPCDWNSTEVRGRGAGVAEQFYGGDIPGITARLDHLAALGMDIVYLTPFFPAHSNHRYDASTFDSVDPLLGGDEALIKLVEAAHARGMKVVGDLTANHSGSSHEWFQRALADPSAPETDYYYFSPDHMSYESWWGIPSLPKFNWASAGLREAFVSGEDSVVARWLKPPFNLDGWRIDVGNMTGRLGAQDVNHEVAKLIRDRVVEINPDALLLGESTSDAAPDVDGSGWQGAMTYSNFTRPLWQWLSGEAPDVDFFGTPLRGPNRIPAEDFLATHRDLASAFSWQVRSANMNALNTHDTARAASVMLPGGQLVGAAMAFTLPGIPVVFAGDEFGLEGANGEFSRTPMPWNDPSRIITDLRGAYGELAALRHGHAAATGGGLRWLHAAGDVLAYVRESAEGSLLVVASRADFSGLGFDAPILPAAALSALASAPLFAAGQWTWTTAYGAAVLSGTGPGAYIWELPGTVVPNAPSEDAAVS
ncbi:glycoside hydrolase family 13 protein [Arthrobacter sp. 35W]|uniref:glycoside hydrolase family 13 protein n=1 Tax=Arthrobacter sp. 35W TaxID=1132441 RepID=UPI000407A294|nr:glycoside hydrolase family 13 protein [Arthrobacter sp. 35W]